MRFENRVVLVTGSGRGFGAALARAFAKEGADVVVHYNSSSAGAEEVAAEIRDLGRTALTVQGNIASWSDCKRVTAEAFAKFGHVDVLVNNVGDMASHQMSWRDITQESIDHTLDVDVKGTLFMIHEVGSRMIERGGAIVNIGSQVVVAGSPRAPQYAAAKYAVIGLTKSYAHALAPHVRVNTLGAGFMETEQLKAREDWRTGRRERVLEQTPLKRIAQPEDMVGPTLFLASDDARHITGQFMLCNGGLAMMGA